MALRGGLRDEDAAREHGEADNHYRQRRDQREQHTGDGEHDGSANAGAKADMGDEIACGRGYDESDEVDEEQRAERRGGEMEWPGVQVKGDPGEDANH